ncbi:MAG TPA: hypothetical protein EYN91_14915 [Candidatus Melainabacteria bacterium]|nr:hypothetical protein [Candidatus Melainabacteria bacterium]
MNSRLEGGAPSASLKTTVDAWRRQYKTGACDAPATKTGRMRFAGYKDKAHAMRRLQRQDACDAPPGY